MPAQPATLENLKAKFGELPTSEFRGQTRVVVAKEVIADALAHLKSSGFDLLVDVTCVDYLGWRNDVEARFGLVYALANTTTSERIFLRVFLDEPDLKVPSAQPLWKGADWMEREVYDMFGIVFEGHPDLRRILLPEEFEAHPLRKDYPLQGRGERHNFPVITRARG
jgi:NADH-quinone oxidoreductase subunit C